MHATPDAIDEEWLQSATNLHYYKFLTQDPFTTPS